MSDHSELKRLAEAAPEGPWFGPEYAPGTSYVFDVDLGTLLHYESIETEKDACLRYIAAANPAAVLALIADLERTTAELKRMTESRKSVVRMKLDAQQELDQLKAENDALRDGASFRAVQSLRQDCEDLRKDAERYRWLRDQHWDSSAICCVVDPKLCTKLGSYCPSLELLDQAVDAGLKLSKESPNG